MRSWIVVAGLVALLASGGCSQQASNAPSVQDYAQKRAELSKRQGQQVARKPAGKKTGEAGSEDAGLVAKTGAGYEYDASKKRDPFRSYVIEQAEKLARDRTERGPLEQYDLNQLTVVAVVWGTDRPRALVEDPAGRGFVVQEGTPIGKNDGLVLRIQDNSVLVRETYVDYIGDTTIKEIEMRVRATTQGG